MEFHIARKARERYGIADTLFSYNGNVIFANVAASRQVALQVNTVRAASTLPSEPTPEPMHAAALFAMGLIDELSHALIARYREDLDPTVLPEALRWFAAHTNQAGLETLLHSFTGQFPNTAIYRGDQTVDQWLRGIEDGLPNREAAFEELLMLWLANVNPAFAPFREFFHDEDLKQKTIYKAVTENLTGYFETRPLVAPEIGTLLDALLAPMLASPDSLTGQLAFIRERWTEHLGEDLKQVLLAMDVLKEEDIAIWMQFHPPTGAAWRPEQKQGWGAEGFVGDEYIGFEGETTLERQRRLHGTAQEPVVNEYEAFSPDQAWMPTVVLIAKSTYVWLEQLSQKYKRHIHRLDQIPDEELALLADRGLNGLWLIGLWERSAASQTIKRLRGQADAVASAYSLRDYLIAEDLGGEAAYRNLRDRAAAKGIRLASDMVPNHMGIDSTWVMDHPEWFISRPQSPFPVYQFEGPDLSNDSRYEIKIEDHYFDQTDAAVVFRLRQRSSGHTEFVYHGNDGTTFAWNDTAQLDYSKAVVREQVMQTILAVARLFPIIRFDAAMTLAKKHVQRLWFPLPGVGGSIPSRAEDAISNEEFDALMPNEFWREVVDRVAVEVPGTLLLAEAFWLLEGYFVRTLGMHRVYNSAFMNMLRDEENAKYRSYLKKTIEFDPDILKRYVNFMSNPDERTAVDQFGSGDRYFGVCTVLATIPGLPMFGHGQVEAFTEKYGMEYKQARFVEYPNEDLIARHQREIAPLLKNRRLFAESANFVLYDFWTADGTVDENVFVYSNRLEDERAIIFFNNRYGGTRGTIHISAESMDKASGTLRSRRLSDALNLGSDDPLIVAYKDTVTGLEYLCRSRAMDYEGLTVELRAYQYMVLQNWRELRSTAERPWDRLCDTLQGAGVYSVDEALSKLRLLPIHESLRSVLSASCIQQAIDLSVQNRLMEQKAPPETKTETRPAASSDETRADLPKPASAASPAAAFLTMDEVAARLSPMLDRHAAFLAAVQGFEPAWPVAAAAEQETLRAITAMLHLPALLSLDAASKPEVEAKPVSGSKPVSQPASAPRPAWPKTASAALPVQTPESLSLALWSPIVAWNVLRTLSPKAEVIPEIFSQLQLRSALAQSFSALGLEGENAWRAAARIRILLVHRPDGSAITLRKLLASTAFWNDPEVRWLAGVGSFEGKTFFNKEAFEELLFWLALHDLIPDSTRPVEPANQLAEEAMRPLQDLLTLAESSGFELQALLALLNEPSAKQPGQKPAQEPMQPKAALTQEAAPIATPAKPNAATRKSKAKQDEAEQVGSK